MKEICDEVCKKINKVDQARRDNYYKIIQESKSCDVRKGKFNNIHMSIDIDGEGDYDYNELIALLTIVPNKTKPAHDHIRLSTNQVKKLRDWCNYYLDIVTYSSC